MLADLIGCASDTLVTPAHCRRAAFLLGASYRELAITGGHVWMLSDGERLATELQRNSSARSLAASTTPSAS